MTTILAAKSFSVTIGTQDWSDWVTEFTTGYTEVDDGVVETQAILKLGLPANFNQLPSDPRYELNPTQWARGQSVQVQVRNDLGVWVSHPCGKLFILDEPTDAEINTEFSISLGCALSLNNFREPDSDVSGVIIGVSTPRHTVIGKILDTAQVPHSLAAMGTSFDYPLPKRGGSYVEQAGTLARAVNQILYCDSTGAARNAAIDFAQAAYATIEVGEDETLWEPSKGNEIPIEELIISGVAYDLINPNTGSTFVNIEYVSAGELDPGAFRPNAQVIGKRTTTTDYGYNPVDRTQRIFVKVEAPIITIQPAPTGSSIGYNPLLLVIVETVDTVETFDALGKLITLTTTTRQPQLVINAADPTIALSIAKVETSRYTYLEEQIAKITTEIKQAAILVNPAAANPFSLVYSESSEKSWQEQPAKSAVWIATEKYSVAQVRVRGEPVGSAIGFNPYLPISDPDKEDIFQRGNGSEVQPPATQYRNPDRSQRERQIKTVVHSQPLAGSGFATRKRSISIEGCTSEAQLYQYGLIFNRLIVGRRFGRRIGFRVSDAWLAAAVKPLLRIDVLYKGATYKLLLDGLTYSHSPTESYIVANGILIEANGVQLVNPLIRARLGAVTSACTVAATAEVSGNVLLATCSACEVEAIGYAFTSAGAIDFRIDNLENSITLGVL